MEMLDLVLEQIECKTRSKVIIRSASEKIKQSQIKWMSTNLDGFDIQPNILIDIITTIRKEVLKNKPDVLDFNILKSMTLWQCAFYSLASKQDADMFRTYKYMMMHYIDVYTEIINDIVAVEKIPFTYVLDLSMPVSKSILEISTYCDALQIATTSVCKIMDLGIAKECPGVMPFLVFHHEILGKEAEWETRLVHWKACYKAYNLHCIEGLGKVEVIRNLSDSPWAFLYNFNLGSTEQANAIHKLDGFLDDAKLLIASATNGTFPY